MSGIQDTFSALQLSSQIFKLIYDILIRIFIKAERLLLVYHWTYFEIFILRKYQLNYVTYLEM